MVEDDISVWEFAAYVFNYSIHKFWDCGRSVHGVLAGERERQVACGGDVECGHRGQSFRCRGCMVQGVVEGAIVSVKFRSQSHNQITWCIVYKIRSKTGSVTGKI
jgi:hypothetical protein